MSDLTSLRAPSGRWLVGTTCRCGISFRDCSVDEARYGRQCCWRCERNEREAHAIRGGGDADTLSALTDSDRAHLRTLGWIDPIALDQEWLTTRSGGGSLRG